MRLDTTLDASVETLTRCSSMLADVLVGLREGSGLSLRDGMVALRGTNYDPSSSPSRQHCWTHERDYRACQDGDTGECVTETINPHDPTGEAAVAYNEARASHRRLSRAIIDVHRAALIIEAECAKHQVARVVNDRAGIGVCDGCGHYCDGVKDNRLRPVGDQRMCNRCRMRWSRAS